MNFDRPSSVSTRPSHRSHVSRASDVSLAALGTAIVFSSGMIARPLAAQGREPPVVGRWDLTLTTATGTAPSWLEVLPSGNGYLVGRFVAIVGSARPISRVAWSGDTLRFAIPPQWERGTDDLRVEGTIAGDRLAGTVSMPDGRRLPFTASRAPDLVHATPQWAAPMPLFNGKDLTGWTTRGRNTWRVDNGILSSGGGGGNLVSDAKFTDFKLHVEFRYPKGSNSGVYLRGRYEVQIEDSERRGVPRADEVGAVYGFLAPNESAARPVSDWQVYDITLVGRRVTVVFNGRTVIAEQLIPGPTGGALDADEGMPGPIYLQGDHGAVEFRSVLLTPARP